MNQLNKEQVNQILTDLKKYWDGKLTELKNPATIDSKEWIDFFQGKSLAEIYKKAWLTTGLTALEAQKAWNNGWKNAKYPIVNKKIPNYDYQFKGSGITIDNFQVDVQNVDQDQLNFSCHLLTDIKKANSLKELEVVTGKRITDLKDELLPESRKQADIRKAWKERIEVITPKRSEVILDEVEPTEESNPSEIGVKKMLVLDNTELKKEHQILGINKNANGTEKYPENSTIREVVHLANNLVNHFREQRIRKLFAEETLKIYDEKIALENKLQKLKAEPFPRYNLKFVWDTERINRAGNAVEMAERVLHLAGNSGVCSNQKTNQVKTTTLWIKIRYLNGIFSPALTFNTLAHEMTHSAVGSGWVNHSQVKKEYLDHFKGDNFYLDLDSAKIDGVFGSHTPLFWIYFMDRTVNGLGASTAEFVYEELKDTLFQEEFGKLSSLNTIPREYSTSDIFKCYYSDVRHETSKDTCLTSPFMDGDTASREWYSVMSKVCDITIKSLEADYNTVHGVVDIVKNSAEFKLEAKKGIEKYLGFDLRALRGDASNVGKFYFKLYLGEHNLNGTTIWNELLKKGWTKTLTFKLTPKPTI